ncbi:DUF2357 domain-containing protein [Chitinophaga tropicalis]|uniref:DUF2357 domain-containing protein n=1 Tax=Chitinophaga tropicalis TaxID=2683588 RepID=A0A7K1U9S9_9BACT|nr:DUF2357 domain-containing protein [Chitinophaga tropicalis]MVT11127.1 DUF2357 domain-containing protein [Chitinophaga tropicalis]
MKILGIKHRDFKLHVSIFRPSQDDETFERTFRTAKKNHSRINFTTTYELTGPVQQFDIWHPDQPGLQAGHLNTPALPLFFEDRYYKFVIEFAEDIVEPIIYSRSKEIKQSFTLTVTDEEKYFLSGTLFFNNDIGTFDLALSYRRGTVQQTAIFRFDVFPVKLDFKTDFPIIVKGIEKGYPRLVLDYLRRTSVPFDSLSGQTDDFLWWIIFGNIYTRLLQNLRAILADPYKSMASVYLYQQQEGAWSGDTLIAERAIRYEGEPAKFLPVQVFKATEDNKESRLVKHILEDISCKFEPIYNAVRKDIAGKRMTVEFKAQLDFVSRVLSEMRHHPFFRQVGEFNELAQLSSVIAERSAYADLVREWTYLKKAYSLFEGIFRMELRDISYLYRIWCFFRIERILRICLGAPVRIEKVPELFSVQLKERQCREMNAGVVFKAKNGNIVELFHELSYDLRKRRKEDALIITPDIVLRIRRADCPRKIAYTSIFNASYQYAASANLKEAPDEPWLEDLKNMSYLRDKIYSGEHPGKQAPALRKDWMGAYVFYPGKGTKEQLRQKLEYAWETTNTGGLALRPGDEDGEMALRYYIEHQLQKADDVIDDMLVAHGEKLQPGEGVVFIAFIGATDTAMINYLLNGEAEQFVYKDFIQHIGDGAVRYFAPYIEGQGISCFYEISGHYWKSRKEAFAPDHPLFENNTRKCMVLKLERKEILNGCYKVKGRINNKRFTTLKHLLNPKDEHIITIPEQRIAPK